MHGYFACMFICVLYVYLVPTEARAGVRSPGTRVIVECQELNQDLEEHLNHLSITWLSKHVKQGPSHQSLGCLSLFQ